MLVATALLLAAAVKPSSAVLSLSVRWMGKRAAHVPLQVAAFEPQVLSMAQQLHLSVLTRLSIGTQFWVFTYALVVCFVFVCT